VQNSSLTAKPVQAADLATYAGLMQADAYAGFDRLYEAGRIPGPIVEAMCWAHARRKFFDVARLNKAPIALEALERIDTVRPRRIEPLLYKGQVRCFTTFPASPRPSATASTWAAHASSAARFSAAQSWRW
jgi:hypothetical protein